MRAALWGMMAVIAAGTADAKPLMRPLSSPDRMEVPRHRSGARLMKVLRDHFDVLAPHMVEVIRDCPRPRDLVRLTAKDSPYLILSKNHAGPHWMKRAVRDRLIFAAAFAKTKGVRLAVGIAKRSLREQARLWNWRLLEKFAALRAHRKGTALARLAKMARPAGEVANPRAFGCSSPHLTGSAVDVLLLDEAGRPLVGFQRKFFYGTKKAYLRKFLTAETPDAKNARLLEELMHSAGFVRYCREAWHFETGGSPLHRYWKAAGKPGRCFGAGKVTWDPRREPEEGAVSELLSGLPRI